MAEQNFREPGFLIEAETLVGRSAFEQPDLESTLRYEGVNFIPQELIESRNAPYVGALRVLAQARRAERPADLAPDKALTWNEKWTDGLNRKKIAEVKEQADQQVSTVFDRLASLQKGEHIDQRHKEIYEGLRKHQRPYMQGIADFMQEPPVVHEIADSKGVVRPYLIHGATIEAPTGAGKTALIGRTAVAAGIGETFVDESGEERRRRMLVVVPSRTLVRQFTGKTGDDTFRRFAPDISVGGFYSGEKTTNTDVVVMTIEKFVDQVRDNKLGGNPFDLLAIDEAHHLLAPQFLDTLLEQWSKPIIGFTATPERSELRDLRNILPTTIKHADTLNYILEGVLNGAQLFLMRVDPDYDPIMLADDEATANKNQLKQIKQEAINQAVVDFVQPLLEAGRRGIIFCNPGDMSKHAREMALSLSKITLEDGRKVKASCLMSGHTHVGERPSHHVISDYDKGKIDVLTTVDMAKEGLNADIDFVVIAQTIRSRLVLQQCLGRGTRLSAHYPHTIYAQFVVPSLEGNLPMVPLHEIFGLDIVDQGERIGPELASKKRPRIVRDDEKLATIGSFLPTTQHLLRRVEGQVASEVHLSYKLNELIPENYVSVREIYETVKDRGLKITDVQRRLDRAGYAWKSSVEPRDNKLFLHRHYEPNAASFFTDQNLPPQADEHALTLNMLGQHFGLGESAMRRFVNELEEETDIRPAPRLNNRGRVWQYYGPKAIAWLEKRIDEMPIIQQGDITIATIAAELDEHFQAARTRVSDLGYSPVFKRPAEKGGIYMWVYSQQEYDEIMKKLDVIPRAGPDDISLPQIAEIVGISQPKVHKMVTEEERALGYIRRGNTKTGVQSIFHLPRDVADKIIARAQEELKPLAPDYVLVSGLLRIIRANKNNVPYAFRGIERKIKLQNTRTLGYVTWQVAQQMVEKYGYEPDAPVKIDFSRLPQNSEDADPARLTYARAIQLHFMSAHQLGNPDGIIDL